MTNKPRKLKSDKRYTDAPRFKATYGYEGDFKSKYANNLKRMVLEIKKISGEMIKTKK